MAHTAQSTLVALHHVTRYRYDTPVQLGPQLVRLCPTPFCKTPILDYRLAVTPSSHGLQWFHDPNGNWIARLVFPERTTEFRLDVRLTADLAPVNPFNFLVADSAVAWPFWYAPDTARELLAYTSTGPASEALAPLVAEFQAWRGETVPLLVEMNSRLNQLVGYEVRPEHGVQSPADTLARATGSCRDVAWLFVELARQLGFAARFVSGYLLHRPDASTEIDEESDESFSGLHAWAEVYLPGAGWKGFDPTSGVLAAEGHIPLASAADHVSAAPITGTVEPSGVELHHTMRLEPIAAVVPDQLAPRPAFEPPEPAG